MYQTVSQKPDRDKGRRIENLIFLHLGRKYKEIYYLDHRGKGECDFPAFNSGAVQEIIQVCQELTPDNLEREVSGIAETMSFLDFYKGVIVTHSQKDKITHNNMEIEVVPVFEYLVR